MKTKLVLAILILLGAGLAAGGVYFVVEAYSLGGGLDSAEGLLDYIPGGLLLVFSGLVWVVWLPMFARTDHGALLRTGEPATATIVEVRDTGSTLNQQPVFKFTLDVTRPGGAAYRATVRQIVSRPALGALRPGLVVPVRVDPRRPHRVAIDSAGGAGFGAGLVPGAGFGAGFGPGMGAGAGPGSGAGVQGLLPGGPGLPAQSMPAAEAAAAWAAGRIPTAKVMRAADIVRDGVAGTATIRSATPTGLTLGQVQQPADPATAGDPLFMLVLQVAIAGGGTVTAQGVHRVPTGQLTRLAPGQQLPVAYLPDDPAGTTTVDWDRLAPT